VFRHGGMLPVYDVCRQYLAISERVGNVFANSKYSVMEMLKGHVGPLPAYQHICNSRTYTQLITNVNTLAALPTASCITSTYVAPLDASLVSESKRRHTEDGTDGKKDTSYADAASAASSATSSSSTTSIGGADTTNKLNGGSTARKRRRQKQKDKHTRRMQAKYLRANPTTNTTNTNAATIATTNTDTIAAAAATAPANATISLPVISTGA
jgi:hypothetical protein